MKQYAQIAALPLIALLATGAFAADDQTAKPNRLANEASPYLRQHANNPVNWYPWGKEAFEKARKENKPILLSVGYSTCHWCHVMERESFSAKEIADVLNKHFVAIKVDRERRPEIDEMYMLATQILNQSGGWPNNVFLTPELKPFAAITYLPKTEFKSLMQEVSNHWQSNPGPIMGQAEQIGSVMASYMQSRMEARSITPQLLKTLVKQATQNFDTSNGGIGVAPKFPQESLLLFLLEQAERNLDERARKVALTTLDNMIRGGIRDHIGGGFHRYVVDPAWRIPHFEKMLYNQALIAQALTQAVRMTSATRYKIALTETLDHVIRDMGLPGGAFATAFDAESKTADGEKKEGAFYAWKPDELESVLGTDDAAIAAKVLGVTKAGNFHGSSIPHSPTTLSQSAKGLGLTTAALTTKISAIKTKLNTARNSRKPPLRDDKILTAWNALMIRALADASIVLKAARYQNAAVKAANYLWSEHYKKPGELRRFSFEGKTSLAATQPDHAFLAVAFIALHDATGDNLWLKRSEELAAKMHTRFFDKEAGDYVMARTDDPIPPAKVRTDQPVPSGNSSALELYAKLARRALNPDYQQRAHTLLAAVSGAATQSPTSSGYALKSADELLRGERGTIQYLAKGQVRVALTINKDNMPKLQVSIAKGWHINANEPLEDHYIPTSVNLYGPNDPEAEKISYPKPTVQKLGFADKPMALYEGDFTISIALMDAGSPPRSVHFSAQACSDKICLDPETLVMTLPPKPN